ncbi:hypothetical protein Ancab_016561 [Ancistrocladus abbreviatus]
MAGVGGGCDDVVYLGWQYLVGGNEDSSYDMLEVLVVNVFVGCNACSQSLIWFNHAGGTVDGVAYAWLREEITRNCSVFINNIWLFEWFQLCKTLIWFCHAEEWQVGEAIVTGWLFFRYKVIGGNSLPLGKYVAICLFVHSETSCADLVWWQPKPFSSSTE